MYAFLSSIESTNNFLNFYKEFPYTLDNLRIYLDYLTKHNNGVIIVGEAPGYRGAKITGIPLTSGHIIRREKHKIWRDIGKSIILPKVVFEKTADRLWNMLDYFTTEYPIFWNAFPFHPHKLDDLDSNCPVQRDYLKIGEYALKKIVDIYKPRKFIALGRVAQNILIKLFPWQDIYYVRHPSYDYLNIFPQQFRRCYYGK